LGESDITMSTDYTQTLKTIKDAEEASAREIAEKKKALAEKLEKAQAEANAGVVKARTDAETNVSQEVEAAKVTAEAEARKLVESNVKDAERVAQKKLGKNEFKKIIDDILLSEFKGA